MNENESELQKLDQSITTTIKMLSKYVDQPLWPETILLQKREHSLIHKKRQHYLEIWKAQQTTILYTSKN